MGKENKSYRIRTNVDKDTVVNFSVDNTIDNFEILSLNINQANAYKLMGSGTGIIAGRVLANGGFGVPNVKVSVFIEYDGTDKLEQSILYHFTSTKDLDYNGVRYNLLPNEVDDECHQNIGTFPAKRVLLDNDNWIEVFDKYYKFTTRTNESGDYMIYGVPTGMQTVHMDVDLSDIGVLSQRPRDLIYKGYNANMFESPGKFKVDTNIDSLAQVITQDQSVYVYPFWGDTTDSELNASITRCDMNVNYKFEPTCIFMGSVVSDTGENSMSKKCIGAKKQGKMSEMITGEGKIEMIRKTANGQVEQFSINGDNNINSDGVWCYQIPMNLDYVMTDEFGKMVMTDNPNTGIPTRARVRFRLSMAESPNDATARKRARFLIPNNPHLMEEDYPDFTETKEVDYEFGTKTKNENFRDLFWNNVYTVKSYIPRLQKSRLPNNLRHLGIKMVNHSGGHNPIPFNNLRIKFNFVYSFLCTLVKVLVTMVRFINAILSFIGYVFYQLGTLFFKIGKGINIDIVGAHPLEFAAKIFASYNGHAIDDDDGTSPNDFAKWVYNDIQNNRNTCTGVTAWFFRLFFKIGCGIELNGLCETDDGSEINVTPGTYDPTKDIMTELGIETCNDRVDVLYNCIENQLAQDNDVTSFNFYNDWLNGVVYLPLWYRKIKKRRNGEIKKDQWCSTDNTTVRDRKYKKNLRVYATNTPKRVVSGPNGQRMGTIAPLVNNENTVTANANDETGLERIKFSKINDENCYGYQCHKYSRTYFKVYKGLVFEKITMLGDKVYYYKPCDYDLSTGNRDLVTLFATDIVLLGSLNSCDLHGIPQFFKALESTTYNMPPDLLSEYYDYINEDNQSGLDEEDDSEIDMGSRMTENTGADWGNLGVDQSNKPDANENQYDNGGLFYGLTCFNSYTKPKSCINLSRICEFGVSLDESIDVPSTEGSGTETGTDTLTPDGFVSYDEIYNPDYRSMFATLNANFLRTKLNPETGLIEYDFNHMYLDNFDGSLKNLMMANTVNGKTEKSDFTEKANYVGNYNLEQSSDTYLNFRYGNYIKRNNNKIYYYENNNKVGNVLNGLTRVGINGKDRLARYENSFYFYFGLNEGKTAIDKFNNEFFSDCSNNFASDVPYEMTYIGNSWCPPNTSTDGYIAFNMNIDAPFKIRFTNIDTNDVYEQSSINSQKFIFYGTDTVPEGYEKYDKVTLIKNGETAEYDIMPGNGIYDIEVIDAYDNSYEDRIVFELPRIGFVCDVNPFNCRNVDLLARFSEKYIEYQVGDVISIGTTYYELVNNRYTPKVAPTTITVTSGDEYYYKDPIPNTKAETYTAIANHGNRLPFDINNRDICGYISISEVNEENFKIELTPINQNFFGDDYTGVTVTVINGNVTDTGAGYLGLTEDNDITTYYFGVPYANQRYKIRMTMMCDSETESNNTRELNVIVYEDEFKVYINGIDYEMIKSFKTGWNDAKLTEDGEFKNSDLPPASSSYDRNNLYGWDDVLNIGTYDYNGTTKDLKPISNSTDINEILAICDVLSTTYEHNGTGEVSDTTPYSWTEEYCYNAPYLHEGYTIINEPLYDYDGNEVQSGDMIYGVTYYKDDEHTIPAVEGTDYVDTTSDYYTKGTVQRLIYTYQITDGVTLYNSAGQPVDASNIKHDATYYTDSNQINEAVLDIDYIETLNDEELPVERFKIIGGANYKNGNTVVATEDNDGIITITTSSDPNIEYSDLNCMSLSSYNMFIDEINGTINNRGEFSRQVGGAFRINDGETNLTLTAVTKARPVRYLIVGSGEITDASELYDYKPNKVIITPGPVRPSGGTIEPIEPGQIPIYKTFNDLDNTTYNGISNIRIISDGYVVDPSFETPSLAFRMPTLTIGDYYTEYQDDEIVTAGDKYYIPAGFGVGYNEYNFELYYGQTTTVGQYKQEHEITSSIYRKYPGFTKYRINNKDKHPYYTSVINDNNNIVPATDDYSNFESETINKNLLSTFGVHFYDKPLTSEIKFIWSAINNIPTYTKNPLGDDTTIGWYQTIHRYQYSTDVYEYTDNSERLTDGTSVFYTINNGSTFEVYTVNNASGMTVGDVKDILGGNCHVYQGGQSGLLQKMEGMLPKIYNGYVVYTKADGSSTYIKHVPYELPMGGETPDEYLDRYPIRTQLFRIRIHNNETLNCIAFKYNDRIEYYLDGVNGYDNTNLWCAKEIDNTIIYNNDFNNIAQNPIYYYSLLGGNIRSTELSRISTSDITSYYTFDSSTNTYTEIQGVPPEGVKAFGVYYINITGGSATNIIYYGDYNSNLIITRNWKPVDVLMPGFITGYLFNGMPVDSAKSNIKATINGNEIQLYTTEQDRIQKDVYENNRVKRVIYTDCGTNDHPTYGVYRLPDGNTYAPGKNYQYAELPLVDDYLVYTDGYGVDYQYQINGTMSVAYEYPVITYNNFSPKPSSELPAKYEDYLITKTYYTNNEGYLWHQSLYYIFDLDYTDYPLMYYKGENEESGEESNLRYDEVNNRFYFENMPDVFSDIETSGYISKSKSTHFNISNYIREKYFMGNNTYYRWVNTTYSPSVFYTESATPSHGDVLYIKDGDNLKPFNKTVENYKQQLIKFITVNLLDDLENLVGYQYNGEENLNIYDALKIKYQKDKFFAVACCNNQYTISPIMETQRIRAIYNYEGFNNTEGTPVYLVPTASRDFTNEETITGGVHYVEDFYYLNYYRFIMRVATYDADAGEYNAEVYTQVCSLLENTAEKCYIRVVDITQGETLMYWASAIKINMSSLGKEAMSEDGKKILPWLHILVGDITRVERRVAAETNTSKDEGYDVDSQVVIKEFNDYNSMMTDYRQPTVAGYAKWENNDGQTSPSTVYTLNKTLQTGDDVYKKENGTFVKDTQYSVQEISTILGYTKLQLNNGNSYLYVGYEIGNS